MAAGLGFKTFTTGEVLTSADVNGYLMQGVLVFATEAARNSAITSPQEGQFAFTKDTNTTWYYDGAAWVASGASGDVTGVTAGTGITVTDPTGPVPTVTNAMATAITTAGDLIYGTGSGTFTRRGIGSTNQVLTVTGGVPTWATPAGGGGKVLQVVQATTTTGLNTSSTSYQNTSLAATITPTLNTSKVKVIAMQVSTIQASDRRAMYTLFRGDNTGTDLSSGATDGFTTASNQTGGSSNYPLSMQFLDSPATTSATTYTACMKTDGAGQCGVRGSTMQVMILMEIGA